MSINLNKWLCIHYVYTNCLVVPGVFSIQATSTNWVRCLALLLPSIRQGRSTLCHTLNCRHRLGCTRAVEASNVANPYHPKISRNHQSPSGVQFLPFFWGEVCYFCRIGSTMSKKKWGSTSPANNDRLGSAFSNPGVRTNWIYGLWSSHRH